METIYIIIAILVICLLVFLFCLCYSKRPMTFETEIRNRQNKIDEKIRKDRKMIDEERVKFEATANKLIKKNDAIIKKMRDNLKNE